MSASFKPTGTPLFKSTGTLSSQGRVGSRAKVLYNKVARKKFAKSLGGYFIAGKKIGGVKKAIGILKEGRSRGFYKKEAQQGIQKLIGEGYATKKKGIEMAKRMGLSGLKNKKYRRFKDLSEYKDAARKQNRLTQPREIQNINRSTESSDIKIGGYHRKIDSFGQPEKRITSSVGREITSKQILDNHLNKKNLIAPIVSVNPHTQRLAPEILSSSIPQASSHLSPYLRTEHYGAGINNTSNIPPVAPKAESKEDPDEKKDQKTEEKKINIKAGIPGLIDKALAEDVLARMRRFKAEKGEDENEQGEEGVNKKKKPENIWEIINKGKHRYAFSDDYEEDKGENKKEAA